MSIAPGTAPIVPTSTIVSPEIATSAFLGGLPLPSSTVPSRTTIVGSITSPSTVALLSRDATLFTLLNRGSEILFQTHIRDAKLVPPYQTGPWFRSCHRLADDPADLILGGIGARADNSNALVSEGVRMRIDRSECGRTGAFAQSVSVVEQRPLCRG